MGQGGQIASNLLGTAGDAAMAANPVVGMGLKAISAGVGYLNQQAELKKQQEKERRQRAFESLQADKTQGKQVLASYPSLGVTGQGYMKDGGPTNPFVPAEGSYMMDEITLTPQMEALREARNAANNQEDFSRDSKHPLWTETLKGPLTDWYGQRMRDIDSPILKGLLGTGASPVCYDNTCVQSTSEILQRAGMWKGEPEQSNNTFSENPAKHGYRLLEDGQQAPGDIIQYYNQDNATHMGILGENGKYYNDGHVTKPFYERDVNTEKPHRYYRYMTGQADNLAQQALGGKIPSQGADYLAERNEVVSHGPGQVPSTDQNGDLNQLSQNFSQYDSSSDTHASASQGVGTSGGEFVYSDQLFVKEEDLGQFLNGI